MFEKMKVAIIGSAIECKDFFHIEIARKIGRFLGEKKICVLTGASIGLPHIVLMEARKKGSFGIGYYPSKNEDGLLDYDGLSSIQDFDEVKFIKGFTRRSLDMIEESDLVLVLSGRMGTLSEFAIAFEEGKKIIVFENTLGISKHLKKIVKLTKKKTNSQVYFVKDIDLGLEVIDSLYTSHPNLSKTKPSPKS